MRTISGVRKTLKKTLMVLLSTLMVCMMLPAGMLTASASTTSLTTFYIDKGNITIGSKTVTGYDKNGSIITTISSAYIITQTMTYTGAADHPITNATEHTIKVTDGTQNITLKGVDIESTSCAFSISENATVNLTLSGINILQSKAQQGDSVSCMNLSSGTTISIDKTPGSSDSACSLKVVGNTGISDAGGTVNIIGGSVSAIGTDGAGIVNAGSTVNISGGTVHAIGTNGAGIGGGTDGADIAGGTVNISGGTVYATSTNGAGIGGGTDDADVAGSAGGAGGTVNISGGMVSATSSNGAGIGGGEGIGGGAGGGAGISGGAGGTVNISGGTVSATSKYGAGIGGGADISEDAGNAGGAGGTVNISGGTVNATSTKGAGIGGGCSILMGALGKGGSVVISGGSVNAKIESRPTIDGKTAVFETTVSLPGGNANEQVSYLVGNGASVSATTDTNGKLYLWLAPGSYVFNIAAGNSQYAATGTVLSNDSNLITAVGIFSFTVGTAADATTLSPNAALSVTANVTNSQSSSRNMILVLILYDAGGNLVNYSCTSATVAANSFSTITGKGFTLPSSVTGYTAKAIICDGTDIMSSSLTPLFDSEQISG
jgi:hypothetical protein